MKKILTFLVVAFLVLTLSGTSYGASRIGSVGRESLTIVNVDGGHVHVSTSPVDVWRITLTTEATSTFVQLINSSGMGTYSNMNSYLSAKCAPGVVGNNASATFAVRNVKADLSAATAGLSAIFTFDPPIRFDQGLLAGFADKTAAPTSQDDTSALIEYTPVVN